MKSLGSVGSRPIGRHLLGYGILVEPWYERCERRSEARRNGLVIKINLARRRRDVDARSTKKRHGAATNVYRRFFRRRYPALLS